MGLITAEFTRDWRERIITCAVHRELEIEDKVQPS